MLLPIQIFKSGCYVALGGIDVCINDTELADIAATYNRQRQKAPLVLGHPFDDKPAYGWVESLHYSDGALYAALQQVAPELIDWVRAGRYKHVSAGFYPPFAPANPRPGKYFLKHVGFLGAMVPAVKGLAPLMLCECADCVSSAQTQPLALAEPYPSWSGCLQAVVS